MAAAVASVIGGDAAGFSPSSAEALAGSTSAFSISSIPSTLGGSSSSLRKIRKLSSPWTGKVGQSGGSFFSVAAQSPKTGEVLVGGMGGLQLWSVRGLARTINQPIEAKGEAPVGCDYISALRLWAVAYPCGLFVLNDKLTVQLRILSGKRRRLTCLVPLNYHCAVLCGDEDGLISCVQLRRTNHMLSHVETHVATDNYGVCTKVLKLSTCSAPIANGSDHQKADHETVWCHFEDGIVLIFFAENETTACTPRGGGARCVNLTLQTSLQLPDRNQPVAFHLPYLVTSSPATSSSITDPSLYIYKIEPASADQRSGTLVEVASTLIPSEAVCLDLFPEGNDTLTALAGCMDGVVRRYFICKKDTADVSVAGSHRVANQPVQFLISDSNSTGRRICIAASGKTLSIIELLSPVQVLSADLDAPSPLSRCETSGRGSWLAYAHEARGKIISIQNSERTTTGGVRFHISRVPIPFVWRSSELTCVATMANREKIDTHFLVHGYSDGNIEIHSANSGILECKASSTEKGVSWSPITALITEGDVIIAGDSDGRIHLFLLLFAEQCSGESKKNPTRRRAELQWSGEIHPGGSVGHICVARRSPIEERFWILSSCPRAVCMTAVSFGGSSTTAFFSTGRRRLRGSLFARCTLSSPISGVTGIFADEVERVLVLGGCSDGWVKVWYLDTQVAFGIEQNRPAWERRAHAACVTCADSIKSPVKIRRGGKTVALALTASLDHSLCIYELQTSAEDGESPFIFPIHRIHFPLPTPANQPMYAIFMAGSSEDEVVILASSSSGSSNEAGTLLCPGFCYRFSANDEAFASPVVSVCIRRDPEQLLSLQSSNSEGWMKEATSSGMIREDVVMVDMPACGIADSEPRKDSLRLSKRIPRPHPAHSALGKEGEKGGENSTRSLSASASSVPAPFQGLSSTKATTKSYQQMKKSFIKCEFNSMGEKVRVVVPLSDTMTGSLPPSPLADWKATSKGRLGIVHANLNGQRKVLAHRIMDRVPHAFLHLWSQKGQKNIACGVGSAASKLHLLSQKDTVSAVRLLLSHCFGRNVPLANLPVATYRYFVTQYGADLGEPYLLRFLASALSHASKEPLLRLFGCFLGIGGGEVKNLTPAISHLLFAAAKWLHEREERTSSSDEADEHLCVSQLNAHLFLQHLVAPGWGNGSTTIESLTDFVESRETGYVRTDEFLERIQLVCLAADEGLRQATDVIFEPRGDTILIATSRCISADSPPRKSDPHRAASIRDERNAHLLSLKLILDCFIILDSERSGLLPGTIFKDVLLNRGPWVAPSTPHGYTEADEAAQSIVDQFGDTITGEVCYLDVWLRFYSLVTSLNLSPSLVTLSQATTMMRSNFVSVEIDVLRALVAYTQTFNYAAGTLFTLKVAFRVAAGRKDYFVPQQVTPHTQSRAPGKLSLTRPCCERELPADSPTDSKCTNGASGPRFHRSKDCYAGRVAPVVYSNSTNPVEKAKASLRLKELDAALDVENNGPLRGHESVGESSIHAEKAHQEPPIIHLDSGIMLESSHLKEMTSSSERPEQLIATQYIRCPYLEPIRSLSRYTVGSTSQELNEKLTMNDRATRHSATQALRNSHTASQRRRTSPQDREEMCTPSISSATVDSRRRKLPGKSSMKIKSISSREKAPFETEGSINGDERVGDDTPSPWTSDCKRTKEVATSTILNESKDREQRRSSGVSDVIISGVNDDASAVLGGTRDEENLTSATPGSQVSTNQKQHEHDKKIINQRDIIRAMIRKKKAAKMQAAVAMMNLLEEEAERKRRKQEDDEAAKLTAEQSKAELEALRLKNAELKRKELEKHQNMLLEEKLKREAESFRREEILAAKRAEAQRLQEEAASALRAKEIEEEERRRRARKEREKTEQEDAALQERLRQEEAERLMLLEREEKEAEAALISAELVLMEENDVDTDRLIKEVEEYLAHLQRMESERKAESQATLTRIIDNIVEASETQNFAREDGFCRDWQLLWEESVEAPVSSAIPLDRFLPRVILGPSGTPIDVELWSPRCLARMTPRQSNINVPLAFHFNHVQYNGSSLVNCREVTEKASSSNLGDVEEDADPLEDAESEREWMRDLLSTSSASSLSQLFEEESIPLSSYLSISEAKGASPVSWDRVASLLEEALNLFPKGCSATQQDEQEIRRRELEQAKYNLEHWKSPYTGAANGMGQTSILGEIHTQSRQIPDSLPGLLAGMPLSGHIACGEWKFFRFAVCPGRVYVVSVTPLSGDPDIFVSRGFLPSVVEHHWKSTKLSGIDKVVIGPQSPHFDPRSQYYVGITSLCGDSDFRITLQVQHGGLSKSESMKRACTIIKRLSILSSFDTDRLLCDFAGASLETRTIMMDDDEDTDITEGDPHHSLENDFHSEATTTYSAATTTRSSASTAHASSPPLLLKKMLRSGSDAKFGSLKVTPNPRSSRYRLSQLDKPLKREIELRTVGAAARNPVHLARRGASNGENKHSRNEKSNSGNDIPNVVAFNCELSLESGCIQPLTQTSPDFRN